MKSNRVPQTLVQAIQSELSTLPQFSTSRCIYRVPRLMRQVNEQAYTPILVSIGPLHYKDPNLLPMEDHKLKCLESFLNRTLPLQGPEKNGDLQSYLQVVKDSETKIRHCYANLPNQLSSDEFIRMVLLDSIFIIEFFRTFFNSSLREDDHIFGPSVTFHQIARDIKLAENQLPFFILKDLYWTAFRPNGCTVPYFTDMACLFLRVDKSKVCIDSKTHEATCCHLLDLLRANYAMPSEVKAECKVTIDEASIKEFKTNIKNGISFMCPTATTLHEAGIKFQVTTCSSCMVADIHFDKEKGILTMPILILADEAEVLLRNLIAFEQCQYFMSATYFRRYLIFLDDLINTSQDVELLVKAGILVNCLGSEKHVFNLLNSLCKHISFCAQRSHYPAISQQLKSYCNRPWNRYRATLKRTYFRHPWAVISVIYMAILLILTIIQVVTGIVSLAPDRRN